MLPLPQADAATMDHTVALGRDSWVAGELVSGLLLRDMQLIHSEKSGRLFRKTETLFSLKILVPKHYLVQSLGMPQRFGDEVRGRASQEQYTHLPELRGDRAPVPL